MNTARRGRLKRRPRTPPAQRAETADEAATEAAKTAEEPVEAEAQAATAQPPPEGAGSATGADEAEAAAGAATAGGVDPALGEQEEGAGDRDTPSSQRTPSPQARPEAALSRKQGASGTSTSIEASTPLGDSGALIARDPCHPAAHRSSVFRRARQTLDEMEAQHAEEELARAKERCRIRGIQGPTNA